MNVWCRLDFDKQFYPAASSCGHVGLGNPYCNMRCLYWGLLLRALRQRPKDFRLDIVGSKPIGISLFASLMILTFGAGVISLDSLESRWLAKKCI